MNRTVQTKQTVATKWQAGALRAYAIRPNGGAIRWMLAFCKFAPEHGRAKGYTVECHGKTYSRGVVMLQIM